MPGVMPKNVARVSNAQVIHNYPQVGKKLAYLGPLTTYAPGSTMGEQLIFQPNLL